MYHLSWEHEKRCAAYFLGVLERGFPTNIKRAQNVQRQRVCLWTMSVLSLSILLSAVSGV